MIRGHVGIGAPLVSAAVAVAIGLGAVVAAGSGNASAPPANPLQVPTTQGNPSAGAVADPGACAHGASPEGTVQGEVPLADRQNGRSEKGYSCNLSLVGRYQGTGASWVSQSYKTCAYMSAAFPGDQQGPEPGTRVVDASDQAHPKLVEVLTSPAMTMGTWESLKVNEARGLLAGVAVGSGDSAGFFDVYDISKDCAHPKLLNSFQSTALTLPANGVGHEGAWAPDGRTYYSSSLFGGNVTAIDVTDPTSPKILWTGLPNLENHGFSLSPDGNSLYLANLVNGAGMDVFDVSQIQHRYTLPQVGFVGGIRWSDGATTQATIPITYHGTRYVVVWDEFGSGGVRFLDITDPRYPTIASQIRLGIDMPKNSSAASADTANTGLFGYESHYCSVDRQVDPTALACGWFQSGVRVFDIRDIFHPKEIAYFNPPAQTGKGTALSDSNHSGGSNSTQLTADWCSSPPAFNGDELWVTCQDNGFMILKFADGVFPIQTDTGTPAPPEDASLPDRGTSGAGSSGGAAGGAGGASNSKPSRKTPTKRATTKPRRSTKRACRLGTTISIVVRAKSRTKIRQLKVYENGRMVKRVNANARVVRAKIVRSRGARLKVRVVEVLSNGRRVSSTRTYPGCR